MIGYASTGHVQIVASMTQIVVVPRPALWKQGGVWLQRAVRWSKTALGVKCVRIMNVSTDVWKPPIAQVVNPVLMVFALNPHHVYEMWIAAASACV